MLSSKLITVFLTVIVVNAQIQFLQNCDDAPSPEMRDTCLNLQRMARTSRQRLASGRAPPIPPHLQPAPVIPGSRGQVASHPYDCMTVTCLCPYFLGTVNAQGICTLPNGQPLTMAYRKEYRMLSEEERLRYHNAMTALKTSGEYDRLGLEHQSVGQGSGAHSGPGFLPWHREYLKRFEIALRLIDPSVAIPYWDSVLDSYLPDPRDSVFFTPFFMGETDEFGNVVTGPWGYWSTLDGRNAILRNLGARGRLFTEGDVANIVAQDNIANVMAYTAPLVDCPAPINFGALEYIHSFVHIWIGGHMEPPESSSNDPVFFSHHSFMDFLWELWRQMRQTRWQRETEYTPDIALCADPQHFSNAVMRPFFNLINRDGLSNMYTDQMYRYMPRPGCTPEVPTCGSPYLFCDNRGFGAHCVSKIKLGGVCIGFEGLDACFMGVCVMGQCVPGPTPAPFIPQTQLPLAQRTEINAAQVTRHFVDCFNRDPCCEHWSRQNECRNNGNYMRQYCRAACGVCHPAYNISNECIDRHISCHQWSTEGQCHGNSSSFMAENCRSSCNLCGTPKNSKCKKPIQLSPSSKPSTSWSNNALKKNILNRMLVGSKDASSRKH